MKILHFVHYALWNCGKKMKAYLVCEIPLKHLFRINVFHCSGIVIAREATLGKNVTVWQGVTIGRHPDKPGAFPVIGDNVRILPYAIIVGGVRVGNNSTIGARSYIDKDIPSNAVVHPVLLHELEAQK